MICVYDQLIVKGIPCKIFGTGVPLTFVSVNVGLLNLKLEDGKATAILLKSKILICKSFSTRLFFAGVSQI